jgi:hypothetical protein
VALLPLPPAVKRQAKRGDLERILLSGKQLLDDSNPRREVAFLVRPGNLVSVQTGKIEYFSCRGRYSL